MAEAVKEQGMPNDLRPPDLKIGPWDIWTRGERPPDLPQGGQLTGSSYRWFRWEGGPWIQSEMPLHRLLRALAYLSPWLYDQPQGADCPDCGHAWARLEHAEDCPRGKALRMMDGEEPKAPTSPALAFLSEIGRELKRQDNLATADPIWLVQEKERIYGIDEAHCDPDGHEMDDDGNEVAYFERWTFGGPASLTRRGIEEYIAIDGHNRREPRAYAVSLWRCPEMIRLRKALMDLADEPASAEPPWWEPRPWGKGGPNLEEIMMDAEGARRIDAFEPGSSPDRWSSAGWYEAQRSGGKWCWANSTCPVETATHWRPKGPPPTSGRD